MTARPMTDRLHDLVERVAAYHPDKKLEAEARALLSTSASLRGMREALDDMKYAVEKLNGAVDAMWNDPVGRTVSARHQADITYAQQVVKKTLDDHAAALSGIEPGDEQARGQGRSAPTSTLSKDTTK